MDRCILAERAGRVLSAMGKLRKTLDEIAPEQPPGKAGQGQAVLL